MNAPGLWELALELSHQYKFGGKDIFCAVANC